MSVKRANRKSFFWVFSTHARTSPHCEPPPAPMSFHLHLVCVCVTVWKLCPNRWRERQTDRKEEEERPAGLILLKPILFLFCQGALRLSKPLSLWTSHLLRGMAMSLQPLTHTHSLIHSQDDRDGSMKKRRKERCGRYRTRDERRGRWRWNKTKEKNLRAGGIAGM